VGRPRKTPLASAPPPKPKTEKPVVEQQAAEVTPFFIPSLAIRNVRNQNDGVTHQNRDAGGALVLPETYTSTVSPASGIVPTALAGDFRAGGTFVCAVLGTGDNPDRQTLYTPEAV